MDKQEWCAQALGVRVQHPGDADVGRRAVSLTSCPRQRLAFLVRLDVGKALSKQGCGVGHSQVEHIRRRPLGRSRVGGHCNAASFGRSVLTSQLR